MTDRETMQQALEALELYVDYEGATSSADKAITALRERLAQPDQKPVAWFTVDEINEWAARYLEKHPDQETRQWQGLTEAEKVNVAIDCGCADVAWMDFADAIEAKLREKNHG